MTWFKDLMSIGKGAFSDDSDPQNVQKEEIRKEKKESEVTAEEEPFTLDPEIETLNDVPDDPSVEDKDVIGLQIDKIFPRLKAGRIESAESMVASAQISGTTKELKLSRHAFPAGFNIGPDFVCCYVIDKGDTYQLLNQNQVDQSDFSSHEVYKIAVTNFLKLQGHRMQLYKTKFEGIRMMHIDGNMEANSFLIDEVWKNVCTELESDSVFVAVPLQDIVLCWKDIEADTLNRMVIAINETISMQPASRRVSNYLYEFKDGKFLQKEQLFQVI